MNKVFLATIFSLFFVGTAWAGTEGIAGFNLSAIFSSLFLKYPILMSIFSAMGIARILFKPLFSFLHAFADATATTKDNEILEKAEASAIYKGVAYVLDYIASIKIGPQVPPTV